MALRNQRQVQAAMERGAAQAIRRMRTAYARDIAPLLAAIREARGEKDLERRLGKSLLRAMGTKATSETLGLELLKAAAGGIASATPRGKRSGGRDDAA